MGCNFGKSQNDSKELQNDKKVEEVEAAPAAVQDSRIPLTVRQKFSISKSWKAIARAMEQTGVSMFIRLFQENEELLNLFVNFRHLKTREDQSESKELAEHANTVMSTIDESIMALENPDYCINFLHDVGKMHRKVEGFKGEYFWKLEEPFLAAVQETLGDRYTENMETIYKITIHFILETVISGYEAAGGNVTQNNI